MKYFMKKEEAQGMMELALIIIVVALIAVGFLSAIGLTVYDVFDSLVTTFSAASN